MHRRKVNFQNQKKPTEADDQEKNLTDALTVNKLRNNELRAYFPGIKLSPVVRRQEFFRQAQHYEEFKKALNTKGAENEREEGKLSPNNFMDTYDMKEFLKRYGLRKKKDENTNQPAMRRTPLRSLKTVKIELPGPYATEAIFSAPRNNKNVSKGEDRLTSKTSKNNEGEDPQAMIEKQLQQTKNEIDIASTQLEQIKELLNRRKLTVTSVQGEKEEVLKKNPRAVRTVDKQCSAIRPQTQWMAKAVNTDSPPSKNKNRLMLTLNNLNHRLQKIQEKYFNAPRIRYKSIRDIPSDENYLKDNSLQTIYRNSNYKRNEAKKPNNCEKATEMLGSLNSPATSDDIKTIIEREDLKINTSNLTCSSDDDNLHPSLQVLFTPKNKVLDNTGSSEMNFVSKTEHLVNHDTKSILKKETKYDLDHGLEAPALQESIFKSNYLMKEFSVNPKDSTVDLSKILARKESRNKKNVRFNQSSEESKKKNLVATMDFALKNSLFYPEN